MTEWQDISTAPKDGTRHRVGHQLDPSSMKEQTICPTYGHFDGMMENWSCSSGFTCQDGKLRWQPTHWLPPTTMVRASA